LGTGRERRGSGAAEERKKQLVRMLQRAEKEVSAGAEAARTRGRDEGARARAEKKRGAWRTVLGASGKPCEQRATRSVKSGKEVREGRGQGEWEVGWVVEIYGGWEKAMEGRARATLARWRCSRVSHTVR